MTKKNGDLYHPLRKLWKEAYPEKMSKLNPELTSRLQFKKIYIHFFLIIFSIILEAESEKAAIAWFSAHRNDRLQVENKMAQLKLKISSKGKAILAALSKHAKNPDKSTATQANEPISYPEPGPCQVVAISLLDPPAVPLVVTVEESNALPQAPTETVGNSIVSVQPTADSNQIELGVPKNTPAQDKVGAELAAAEKELLVLLKAKASGLLLLPSQQERLNELKKYTSEKSKKLKRLKCQQMSQQPTRDKRKSGTQTQSSASGSSLSKHPRLEDKQEGLLEAILDIVSLTCSAAEKRNMEVMRTIKTLDQLLEQMRNRGKWKRVQFKFLRHSCFLVVQ